MVKRLMLVGLIVFSSSVYSYVAGLNHLYNPHTNTIVDILYDHHVPQASLSVEDMATLPFNQLKSELFQTEQRVLGAFDVLNKNAPGLVDIVWEDGIRGCGDSAFIGFPEQLVESQFINLNVIPSDICRDALRKLLLRKNERSLESEIAGVSILNPLPLSDKDIATILSTYGDTTLNNFEKLRLRTTNIVVDRYMDSYLAGAYLEWDDFMNNDFHALADCEMLRNVLSSTKPHIIVYCGAWHSNNIYSFLTTFAGFKPVGKQGMLTHGEINVQDLAPLDKEYRTTAWQSTQTGSSYNKDASKCPDCGRSWEEHK